MNQKPRLFPTTASLALAVVLSSCTDAALEHPALQTGSIDDHLALRGRVCTDPPDPNGFPVKVVMIVDQSGSMCISDPPGSQGVAGLCEQVATLLPPGTTTPARVRAMQSLINQFAQQPNVEVSIVPFDTNVKNVWPPAATGQRFARPLGLDTYLSNLQAQLGKGTDYQGAIAYAYTLIATDIDQTSRSNPELLPRTRYVVVFLTDGTPYPKCSANDNLSVYASPSRPDLIWADEIPDYCNDINSGAGGPGGLAGFTVGTDRNQNYQIFSYVDQLELLKTQYNVGDIRLHTVLLFNQAAVQACGTICQDIYGTFPGIPASQYPAAAHSIAQWLLKQMATRGNGVYQEFIDGQIQSLGLGALDYSSLASRNVLKSLIVESLRSVPGPTGRMVDSDGDGLPDTLDNSYTNNTSTFDPDSDGDCFDDNFEVLHKDRGFVAGNDKDLRGCDPASPLTLNCTCRDTDGDGLSQFAESYLKTNSTLVDSDSDGLPDGLEARAGLDPLASNLGQDTDSDGIADDEEIRAGTNPTLPDRVLYDREAVQYTTTASVQDSGAVCYDYAVTNLKLVTPPNNVGVQEGYNLFKVWFDEAPESAVATDYGVWKVACAWAQYSEQLGGGGGLRIPAGPDLPLNDSNFTTPDRLVLPADYQTRCVGTAP